MADERVKHAKRSVIVSMSGQVVSLICGLIVPRLLIATYGSEAYGVTTSILNFLAYITLLEGGVGGVVRAALYKPLAMNDRAGVAGIVREAEHFFRILGGIFLVYVLILAFGYHSIARVTSLDWETTFLMVIVISFSTLGEYFFGISRSILLNASQRTYLTNGASMTANVINTVVVLVMVSRGCSLLAVKLAWGIVYLTKPVMIRLMAKKIYPLPKVQDRAKGALKEKWAGLGQHIAYFLHKNTDVAVLTLLADLKQVAVYSVYTMIIGQMENFIYSFTSGMEAMFGDMLAKKEREKLLDAVSFYETMLSCVTVVLLATTAAMILPFVAIYTRDVHDANYHQPVFSLVMICAGLVTCLRVPYHNLVIAAGHFRQTQTAAYAEAFLNIGISAVLVSRFGLVGVAVGTLVSVGARYVYYVFYLANHVLHRSVWVAFKRLAVNAAAFGGSLLLGGLVGKSFAIGGYISWAISAVPVCLSIACFTLGINFLLYRQDALRLLKKLKKR